MTPTRRPGSAELARQRRRLARWLVERRLDQTLPPVRSAGCAAWEGPAGVPCFRDPPPSAGQIRLLAPVPGTPTAQRPVYLAVLEETESGALLVAPFGRYGVPAVPGEWRTGLGAPALRVLCLWNSRVIPAGVLRWSWRAGTLRGGTVRRALERHRQVRGGDGPASPCCRDVGPPLRHPLDPRWRYLAEEAAALDESLRAPESMAGRPSSTWGLIADEGRPAGWLLAAEPPAGYGRARGRKRKAGSATAGGPEQR